MDDLRVQRITSVSAIAAELNERGTLTPRDGASHPTSARTVAVAPPSGELNWDHDACADQFRTHATQWLARNSTGPMLQKHRVKPQQLLGYGQGHFAEAVRAYPRDRYSSHSPPAMMSSMKEACHTSPIWTSPSPT